MITEQELERICVCIMKWKTPEDKVTMWGTDIINSMFQQYKETGRVCLDVVRDE